MIRLIDHSDVVQFHRLLTKFNRKRLSPRLCDLGSWQDDLETEFAMRLAEGDMVEHELKAIQHWTKNLPTEVDSFMEWFEQLKVNAPGQNDPLFNWLAREATYPEMKWFIEQEVAGEAGFDDLVALTQVKFPAQAKLELARNYWDEMGRGNQKGMHGPMLNQLAQEMGLHPNEYDVVPEALALGNLLVALATNRRFAYHSVGALGVIELTAPARAAKVYQGLKRLGVSPVGQRYYLLHSTLDVQHSENWNREVLRTLIEENPSLMKPIAEGALMRLHAGARCFERYREILWYKNPARIEMAQAVQ